jgi:hypothetical protein
MELFATLSRNRRLRDIAQPLMHLHRSEHMKRLRGSGGATVFAPIDYIRAILSMLTSLCVIVIQILDYAFLRKPLHVSRHVSVKVSLKAGIYDGH